MTKHINSSEALPSEAHLWLMPHTQTAIKETKTICIYPETSIENSDTIPFTIPALQNKTNFCKNILILYNLIKKINITIMHT